MGPMLLIVACLTLGALVGRGGRSPPGLAQGLNWWVLAVALPALVLVIVPQLELSAALWFPVAAMWLVFGIAWAGFTMLGRALSWSRRTSARSRSCRLQCPHDIGRDPGAAA